MRLMSGLLNPVVLRITLRATLGRKRALVFMLVPLVLLVITVALKLVAASPVWPAEFLGAFGFSVVLPLTALIIGTSVLGAEIDDGSIVHLLATPVSRLSVVISKFTAAVMLTIGFGAIPEFLAGAIAKGPAGKLTLGLLAGALVASVAYNAFFVMLSVLTTRAIAVGLLYLLVWEGLLGNLIGGVRVLSIGQYSVSVANSIARTSALNAHLTAATALIMAAVVTVATLAIGARRLSSFAIKGDAVSERVVRRTLRAPPGMGAHVHAVGGRGDRADVLIGVSGGGDQPDRRTQLGTLGIPGDPQVAVVDRPEVMDPGGGEERRVDRVVRMVMAEDHVGHRRWRDVMGGQGGQQGLPGRHHARIHHHGDVAVGDQRDRAPDAVAAILLARVAVVQDVDPRGARRRDLLIVGVRHNRRHYPARRRSAEPVACVL